MSGFAAAVHMNACVAGSGNDNAGMVDVALYRFAVGVRDRVIDRQTFQICIAIIDDLDFKVIRCSLLRRRIDIVFNENFAEVIGCGVSASDDRACRVHRIGVGKVVLAVTICIRVHRIGVQQRFGNIRNSITIRIGLGILRVGEAGTEQQQRGLRAFMTTGCQACHSGRNLGGASYQKLGAVHDYFERRGGRMTEADHGRFNVTQEEGDRHMFKVPTLRNVALTAPYFHDGHEANLAGAVRTMAYVQLGQELTDAQVADIVAFLGALSGEIPADAYMPGAAGSEAATTPGEPDAEDVVEAHPAAPTGATEDDADRDEAAE